MHKPDSILLTGAAAHKSISWVEKIRPGLVLVYLSLMGSICILGAQRYLGLKPDYMSCLSFMGLIFGIYTLNHYTDSIEDYINDIAKLFFFKKQSGILLLAGATLAGSIGILFLKHNLNWMHLVLLGLGFGYSFKWFPWYKKTTGLYFVRIKEMTLVKNLSVSFLWAGSIFIIPILNSAPIAYDPFLIWMLASGLFLSTLNNTLFDDILDEAGDRVAGIKTLPTTWGARKSQIMLMALDISWIIGVGGLYTADQIDWAHAAFLSFLGLYPFLYMSLKAATKLSKGWIDFLSESDLLLYGLGLLLLSLH